MAKCKIPFAIVTFVNYPYKDLLLNFVCNLQNLNLSQHVHVFSTDYRIESEIRKHNLNLSFHHILNLKNNNNNSSTYGEKEYWYIAKQKTIVHLMANKYFKEYIFSDTDVVWLRSPVDDLRENCKKNICFQNDSFENYTGVNSGFYYVPNTSSSKKFFEEAAKIANRNWFSESGDQLIFNLLLESKEYSNYGTNLSSYYYSHGGFPNIWEDTFFKKRPVKILHNNWIAGLDKKIHRQKFYNAWFINENLKCSTNNSFFREP